MPTSSEPRLPAVDNRADDLVDRIAGAHAGMTWVVEGGPTTGKTVLLAQLEERLRKQGYKPIRIAPPLAALDSGAVALVEIANGLRVQGLVDCRVSDLTKERAPWRDKVALVREWMAAADAKTVFLCDEPMEWAASSADDFRFAAHANDVLLVLLSKGPWLRVVTGRLPESIPAQKLENLAPRSEPGRWLRDRVWWRSLADAAAALAERHEEILTRYSPLQVRLLVAQVTLTNISHVEGLLAGTASRREVSRNLAALLSGQKFEALRSLWARLSLLRRPFPPSFLRPLGAPVLEEQHRDILDLSLLYKVNGSISLHETLRADARDQNWLSTQQARQTHQQLATLYHDLFQSTSQGPPDGSAWASHLTAEMEAFHHALSSGDAKLWKSYKVFFSDQLDALGRRLSQEAQRRRDDGLFSQAVEVFKHALSWDETDDYAHHYLAFNRDVPGREPAIVEGHYQKAIEINPRHSWWWSRYICFLVARGRPSDAERKWDEALDALQLPNPDSDPGVYESLHLWVARILVHRGRIEFAERVLAGIPDDVRQRHLGLKALGRRLAALVEARRAGVVFPLTIPPERWWEGPHLNSQREGRKSLTKWLAARVDSIDDDSVNLFVGTPPKPPNSHPEYGLVPVARAEFDQWSRDWKASELTAGRFVELGYYGHREDVVVARVHRETSWEDPDLPPLFPDPVRYLRRGGHVR